MTQAEYNVEKAKMAAKVDWDALRTTDDPALVLAAFLAIWDPLLPECLDGFGGGEIDTILAARRLVAKARPPREVQMQF